MGERGEGWGVEYWQSACQASIDPESEPQHPHKQTNKQTAGTMAITNLTLGSNTVGPWGSPASQPHQTDQLQAQGEVFLKTEVKFRVGEVAQQACLLHFPGPTVPNTSVSWLIAPGN